jgi:ADP-heptose:LPS heptosyltransferase
MEWLRQVRAERYDLVIDLQCNDRSRLLLGLLWLTGSPDSLSVSATAVSFPTTSRPPNCPNRAQHHSVAAPPCEPAVFRRRRRDRCCMFPITTAPAPETVGASRTHGGSLCNPLPGCNANGHLKRWGADRYSALANRSTIKGWIMSCSIGGPDEIEECQRIAQACGPWLINLCGQTAILDIPSLCEPARFIVANDTGTAHLAAARPYADD